MPANFVFLLWLLLTETVVDWKYFGKVDKSIVVVIEMSNRVSNGKVKKDDATQNKNSDEHFFFLYDGLNKINLTNLATLNTTF